MKLITTFSLSALAAAALGATAHWNPADVIARGKFVRAFQTRKGEAAATLCLPATNEGERAAQLAELPEVVADLERAGARVVVLDVPAEELPSTVFSATALPLVVGAANDGSHPPMPAGVRVGHRGTADIGPAAVVMGVPATAHEASLAPLAAEALALHRGVFPPRYDHDQLVIGDQAWPVADGPHTFMPYEIPFLDWGHPATWTNAPGRTVFVGACRMDRDLTRFGRQPGTVAHAEQFETLRDGLAPRDAGRSVDAGVALASTVAAAAARRWHARLGPLLVGAAVVGLLGWAQLGGLWVSVSGVLAGAGILALRR